jgi:hypothetical protein
MSDPPLDCKSRESHTNAIQRVPNADNQSANYQNTHDPKNCHTPIGMISEHYLHFFRVLLKCPGVPIEAEMAY